MVSQAQHPAGPANGGSDMRIRLDPADEYMHALEDAQTFNESMYFNVYDPKVDVGAWFRLGNRANEGYAEMTTCIYLPAGGSGVSPDKTGGSGVSPDKTGGSGVSPDKKGSVAFMYARPHIESNEAFDAGG